MNDPSRRPAAKPHAGPVARAAYRCASALATVPDLAVPALVRWREQRAQARETRAARAPRSEAERGRSGQPLG